jgi:hypothetical protein
MKAYRWRRGITPLVLNLGSRRPDRFTAGERTAGTHWIRAGLDVSVGRRIYSNIGATGYKNPPKNFSTMHKTGTSARFCFHTILVTRICISFNAFPYSAATRKRRLYVHYQHLHSVYHAASFIFSFLLPQHLSNGTAGVQIRRISKNTHEKRFRPTQPYKHRRLAESRPLWLHKTHITHAYTATVFWQI